MAANTDLYKKVSRRWVGQIGSGGVTDASTATIPLSSATNLPTDTAVVCTIDRVDANGVATASLEETVIGVIILGSNNLTTCTRGVEGTAQAHSAGAVVEVLITAKGWNDLIDAMLTEHSQLGAHGNITLCNITASGVSTLSNVTACSVVALRAVSASTVSASDIVASRNMTASMIGAIGTSKSIGLSTGTYQTAQTYTPAGAATATLDLSKGNDHEITMPAGNITIAISNGTVGQKFIISILQDAVGSRTVTWFSTIKWAGGSAPTLTTTASKRDTFGFKVTGSNTYDGFIVGLNC
jgi:hypothetical protein